MYSVSLFVFELKGHSGMGAPKGYFVNRDPHTLRATQLMHALSSCMYSTLMDIAALHYCPVQLQPETDVYAFAGT